MSGQVDQVRVSIESAEDGTIVLRKRATGPRSARRLTREAEVLTAARHPGVVAIAGRRGADEAFELDLVWAGPHSMQGAPCPPVNEVAGLATSLATTVADLHDLGVVHGDISPEHVLLGVDGRPILCGWGDAALLGRDGATRTGPHVDVAAIGALITGLLGRDSEVEPIPEHRWWRAGRWEGYQRRALLNLADHASDPDPDHRPSARALAEAITKAVPSARLPVDRTVPDPAPTASPHVSADQAAQQAVEASPRFSRRSGSAWRRRRGPDLPAPGDDGEPGPVDPTTDHRRPILPLPAPGPRTTGNATPPAPQPIAAAPGTDGNLPGPDGTTDRARPVLPLPAPEAAGPRARISGRTSRVGQVLPVLAPEPDPKSKPRPPQPVPGGPHERAAKRPGTVDARPLEEQAPPDPTPSPLATTAESGSSDRRTVRIHAGNVGAAPSSRSDASARRPRRPLAIGGVAAGLLLVTVLAVGALADAGGGGRGQPRRAGTAAPAADRAAPHSSCPTIAGPRADVDGDGCADLVVVDGRRLRVGDRSFVVGVPGDRAAAGDWDCDGVATPAVLRPSTGVVYAFAGWPHGTRAPAVTEVARVSAATRLRTQPGSSPDCPVLVVERRAEPAQVLDLRGGR